MKNPLDTRNIARKVTAISMQKGTSSGDSANSVKSKNRVNGTKELSIIRIADKLPRNNAREEK